MKTSNAIKTLEKYTRVNCIPDQRKYWAMRPDREGIARIISFIDQGGEIICLHTRRATDKNDSQSDYFPGSYWDTMAQALRHAWNIETRKALVKL